MPATTPGTVRSITAPFSTLGYDATYQTAIAGFEKIIMNTAGAVPKVTQSLFKVGKDLGKARSIKWRVLSGMDGGGQWDGHSVIPPASMKELWEVTATQYLYANSMTVTFDESFFDLYGIGNLRAGELGKSMADMQEKLFTQFLINEGATGTSFWYGVELKALLSATHLYDSVSGANQSNLVTGGLSYTNLMTSLKAIPEQRDYQGRPLNMKAAKVACHTSWVPEVRNYLNYGMDGKYGEMSNNRNEGKDYPIEIVGLPYLTNSAGTNNGYIVLADQAKLKYSQSMGQTIKTLPMQADHGIKTDGMFSLAMWLDGWEGTHGNIIGA
jgi:hypothetical protein